MSTTRAIHAQSETSLIGWLVAKSARLQLPSVARIRFLSRLLILAVLLAGATSGGLTFG